VLWNTSEKFGEKIVEFLRVLWYTSEEFGKNVEFLRVLRYTSKEYVKNLRVLNSALLYKQRNCKSLLSS
jgi:hypothetical protein